MDINNRIKKLEKEIAKIYQNKPKPQILLFIKEDNDQYPISAEKFQKIITLNREEAIKFFFENHCNKKIDIILSKSIKKILLPLIAEIEKELKKRTKT